MDPLTSLLFPLALGAAMGLFGGVFGIGGGIIAIPVLALGYGMDQTTAQGTALAMMVPNLIIAWWRYARRNPASLGLSAAALAVVSTLTTWAAAHYAQALNPQILQLLFAVFLTILGVRQCLAGRAAAEPGPAAPKRFMPLVGLLSGGSMGLLGIGGGLVATPFLTGLFGLGQRAAQSVALALVTPSAVAALYSYADHHNVDWGLGLALAAGGVATVSAGVALAHAIPERRLQQAFGVMMIATAAALAFKA
ncbi:MAG TPA: sulfite exporter TauE/SafE family protein [Azospirillaceae bacterium]|nr:sulfite exporter TauE/SafE family protein [Azospirillaceae bacterium]HRQ79993.1 sulfite exporter TauE/SafE family protein [Azospirillaceae bacterium]